MFWRAVARADEESDSVDYDAWAYFEKSVEGLNEAIANGMPFSGNERNHLYFGGIPDKHFEDYSSITGIANKWSTGMLKKP